MYTEKELLFQVLDREVDNFLYKISPIAGMMAPNVKAYLHEFVSPYIDAFLIPPEKKKLNTEAASEFTKEEVNDKIASFLKKFEESKKENGM